MEKYVYKIIGMTCAACVARVEKAVKKLEGVGSCGVNLTTERLTVEIDTLITGKDALEQVIKKTGYGFKEIKSSTGIGSVVDEDKERKEKEIASLRVKFIISCVFGIPLLYLARGQMLPFGLSLPYRVLFTIIMHRLILLLHSSL